MWRVQDPSHYPAHSPATNHRITNHSSYVHEDQNSDSFTSQDVLVTAEGLINGATALIHTLEIQVFSTRIHLIWCKQFCCDIHWMQETATSSHLMSCSSSSTPPFMLQLIKLCSDNSKHVDVFEICG